MKRFKNILFCPLSDPDHNARAAARVGDLADRNGANLTMVGVVPELTRLDRLRYSRSHQDLVRSALRDEVTAALEESRLAAGRPVSIAMSDAPNAAIGIVLEVITAGHDLVVVTVGEDRSQQTVLRRLLRKCPCPVWLMRPDATPAPRVLAAVNPDPDEKDLNWLLLELAASINQLYGGELHVAHAWELYGEAMMRTSSFIRVADDELEAMRDNEFTARSKDLGALLHSSSVADAPWVIHVVNGPAAEMVPQLVDDLMIDLIVMGTLGSTRVKGILTGETAEQILDRVSCGVLTAKPPGFVSPLAP